MAKRQRLNRVTRLARNEEQRPRELIIGDGSAHSRGISAIEYAHVARAECARQHIRDQTRSAHPADECPIETVGPGGGGQSRVLVPLRERLFRRARPCKLIHLAAKHNEIRSSLQDRAAARCAVSATAKTSA